MARHVHIYLGWEAFWAEGERLFGSLRDKGRFQCPQCGKISKSEELYKEWDEVPVPKVYDDCCSILTSECDACGLRLGKPICKEKPSKQWLAQLKRPHSARIIFKQDGLHYDHPCFDFYRGDDPEWNVGDEEA